ncbi:glycosyltransferase family 2 protein [Bacillus infantis]|uniref:glycosyltransferase family 2 protein n=1 Tax=Bacillus infantis TaxID=324767 RepID=UPI003CF620A6
MKKVQILMSTYNGERFLEEQLDSLMNQVGVEISILVRDDGSIDSTTKILNKYQKKGLLTWYSGENLKPAYSFLNLMKNAPVADYYAFCDQDDVWEDKKLITAIQKLNMFSSQIPALYFSKAQLFDEKLNIIEGASYPNGTFSFGTALIRNNATGCTMVFNHTLLEFVNQCNPPNFLLMHDHWIYLLCLALNGNVVFDSNSYIKYRQHGNNACGSNHGFIHRFKNSGFSDQGNIRYKIAVQLYENYGNLIPKENKEVLELVINYQKTVKDKVRLLTNFDIKAHSFLSDVALMINILASKL